MDYEGEYEIFDPHAIKTYPVKSRKNRVTYEDVLLMHKEKKPVVLFAGAHLIKNGLGRLLIDLIQRNLITLIAGNAATTIHDFELALIGQTSEDVPFALEKGDFGMAYEFIFQNAALALGNELHLGYG